MPEQLAKRRKRQDARVDFDDQRWPIACALVTLAGVAVGVLWTRGDFTDPRPLHNGWAQLGIVGFVLVSLIWTSALLERRILRRVQLCIVLSLLLHLGLSLALHRQHLKLTLVRQDTPGDGASAILEPLEPLADTLPEYRFDATQTPVTEETLVRPVETAPAEAMQEPLFRQSESAASAALPEPRNAEPAPVVSDPGPTDLQRTEVSAPRQAATAGEQLGRQEFRAELPPTEPLAPSEIQEAADQPTAPQPVELERRESAAVPAVDVLADEPAAEAARPAAPLPVARSLDALQPAIDTSAPSVPAARAVEAPAEVVETAERALSPVESAESRPDVEAATAGTRRAATRLPERSTIANVEPEQAMQPAERSAERLDLPADVPLVAETPASLPRRNATVIEPATVASDAEAPQAVVARPAVNRPELTAPANSLSRRDQANAPTMQAPSSVPIDPASTIEPPRVRRSRAAGGRPDVAREAAADPAALNAAAIERQAPAGDVALDAAGSIAGEDLAPAPAGSAGGSTNELQPDARRTAARMAAGAPPAGSLAASASPQEGVTSLPVPAGPGRAASQRSLSALGGGSPIVDDVPRIPRDATSSGRSGTAANMMAADGTAEFPEVGPTPDAVAASTNDRLASEVDGGASGAPRASDGAASNANRAPADGLAPRIATGGRMTPPALAGPLANVLRGTPTSSDRELPAFDAAAPAGPAGLRRDRAPAVGLNDSLARPQSRVLQPQVERFVLDRSFSAPVISGSITENPIPEFRQRKPAERERTAAARGATAGSERAVELGLEFLVRHQSADGRWTLDKFDNGRPGYEAAGLAQMQSDTAATGLALLAFFGAGYTHLDGKYRSAVGGGLDYLVGNQKPDGDLFTEGSQYVWLYSHGIAAIAVCEAYGMTRDPRLREPAQRALNFIVAAQHPTQGGWRYSPQRESDTSVSGWQMMALKSGELAGLTVPRLAYNRLSGWLDFAQAPGQQGTRYVYLPASRQVQQRSPSAVMTAEALLMRLYLGWERNDPRLLAGADYLLANPPRLGTRTAPTRDAYYWYYATQVMFQVQGSQWEAWNQQLREFLVASQSTDGPLAGSWDPLAPLPDRWGRQAGRLYVTTMHLLMLEVYYRHLPLYKSLTE